MTQVYFYSGASNKLQTACRLCAKAVQQKSMKVLIYAPDTAMLEQLDELLWTFSPTSFIPHCTIRADSKLIRATPVILSDRIPADLPFDVLLNLDLQQPPSFDQFDRLIEIADTSPEGKQAARARYRFYKEADYPIQHFNLDD
ncbi:MAG: DNA polymerase III subunit chi [Gammaproteobacteria bacterium]|nr:MAG: DNA polymerase III subunit chi [Gammaproteobacteria bacterium]